jgi:hypothetical protein
MAIAEIQESLREADRGDFATDVDVRRVIIKRT